LFFYDSYFMSNGTEDSIRIFELAKLQLPFGSR
jgi:hypothetical protein